jgi:hypothetical protein
LSDDEVGDWVSIQWDIQSFPESRERVGVREKCGGDLVVSERLARGLKEEGKHLGGGNQRK